MDAFDEVVMYRYALSVGVAAALLAGCGGAQPPIGAPGAMPQSQTSAIATRAGPVRLNGRRAPAGARRGIYVAQYFGSSVLGYAKNNRGNAPPICSISGVGNVADLATDTLGNLIVPNSSGINIYRGPPMCGPPLATISDSYGQATDAAAVNAATGPIVVANMNGPGFVVVCSARSRKCAQLTPPSTGIGVVGGVAMDKNGNCWADAYNASNTRADLIYWARCTGSGVIATGFQNVEWGGLDVDGKGHVLAIEWHDDYADLWVYSGCKPICSLVAENPLTNNVVFFGHLDRRSQRFAAAAYLRGQVDIYAYTPTTLTYEYSFNRGLSYTKDVEGVAYSPSSMK